MPGIPDDAYTTPEIHIEANRLRRRHYRFFSFLSFFGFAFASVAVFTTRGFIAMREEMWPTIVDAAAVFPFGPEAMYYQLVIFNAANVVLFAAVGLYCWRKRVPEDGAYVLTAVKRLTERGGL